MKAWSNAIPGSLNKQTTQTNKTTKPNKHLKRDASPLLPSLSSDLVCCLYIPTSSFFSCFQTQACIQLLHVCVLPTAQRISYIPTKPPEARNDSHFAVGHGFSSLKILEGSICLFNSHFSSKQRDTLVICYNQTPALQRSNNSRR